MSVGIVVIGRNEGERLKRCLASVMAAAERVVYVDSGSTDGSVDAALKIGAEVVNLDTSTPFTAARARNEGFRRLGETAPGVDFVQFVDGDCEICPGWLAAAVAAFEARPDVAIVAGQLHERHPERSIYNRLGDLEWNFFAPGEVVSVGGIFMIRRSIFAAVGGFNPTVPAGEEPELCQRVIGAGWRLLRLKDDMAWHDLAMTRFAQWWRRQVRNGYGSMDVARRFGLPRFRRNNLRARFWTAWLLALPAMAGGIAVAGFTPEGVLAIAAVAAIWPLQLARIALRTHRLGHARRIAIAYAFFMLVSFWPQMLGQLQYFLDTICGRRLKLIEYKAMPAANGAAGVARGEIERGGPR
jgi:glycosyltransferase involved in cell wall biosynthesis